jgi:hypothetical protein
MMTEPPMTDPHLTAAPHLGYCPDCEYLGDQPDTQPHDHRRAGLADQLTRFASGSDDLPARSGLPDLLADPALTGMSRADLAAMTERVAQIQAARTERHRHRRRGGERLPGARGGVFTQKITDAEQVLATVLYQRKLCTHETLAELFKVSRRTIGNVVRELGPILAQDGYIATTADRRFAKSTALLDAVTDNDTPTLTS